MTKKQIRVGNHEWEGGHRFASLLMYRNKTQQPVTTKEILMRLSKEYHGIEEKYDS